MCSLRDRPNRVESADLRLPIPKTSDGTVSTIGFVLPGILRFFDSNVDARDGLLPRQEIVACRVGFDVPTFSRRRRRAEGGVLRWSCRVAEEEWDTILDLRNDAYQGKLLLGRIDKAKLSRPVRVFNRTPHSGDGLVLGNPFSPIDPDVVRSMSDGAEQRKQRACEELPMHRLP